MAEQRNVATQAANGKSSGSAVAYSIDLSTFSQRLKALYSHWHVNKSDMWGSADVVAIAGAPPSDDLRYLKSSALHIWLLGYEFPDTLMVFMNKQIHFVCSPKKVSLLEVIKTPVRDSVGAEVVMHVKAKSDDGSSGMDSIFHAIRSQSKLDNVDAPVIGYVVKEAPEGNFLAVWDEKLKGSNFKLSDVTMGLSDLFACKQSVELTYVKKAAFLTASVMKNFVVPKVEQVIDEEKEVSHSSLMADTERVILDPARVKVKLMAENVDICYPPIFQSGGVFDLKPSASSNDDNLYYDAGSVIICAIGSRYKSYCSNIARTIMIDANESQLKAYNVLLKAHELAIDALRPGNTASSVYVAALSVVRKEVPQLVNNFTKSSGTGIGLEFRESGLSLNSKNDMVLKVGMVFNVSLGFNNISSLSSDPKGQNSSFLLADTVVVSEKPEVLTSLCSKAVSDIAYSFKEEGEEEENLPNPRNDPAHLSKATLRSDNHEISKEELRRQHQAELARQKNEETARRLAGVDSDTANGRSSSKSSSELCAYRNVNDLPPVQRPTIHVDQKNEAVVIPFLGTMIPFHVSEIRLVSSQQDTNHNCYIRIMFNIPGTPFTSPGSKFPGAIYIKEFQYRSKDARHISDTVNHIKVLRKNVVLRESEKAERATLVAQGKLQLAGNKFKPIRLSELSIRPSVTSRGRKMPGTLEAHVNGFRFSTNRVDEKVEIIYANIKHAFFQPAEKEMITLLHFHLHNHIMVGKKKTIDVQFYVEVMDVVQTVGGGKRSAYDPDEIEEEQRERDRKNKINMDFHSFVSRVNDLWGQAKLDLEFDQPLRELGFHGVPWKTTAFIVPTSCCLVELIETPWLVVTLAEMEIVNLERVGLGQKNFDLTIVFKDFKREVFRIDSVPSTALDGIKEWLDTTDIKYYESRMNLNWRPILKTIMDDPEHFIEEGGWEFLNMDASDSESDDAEESDVGYEPSDAASESESEEEESESASLVESDDDEEEEEEDDEEEEEDKGKTWEELEREASSADRENGDESDSEEERNRRKKKMFGKERSGLPGGGGIKRPKMR